MRDGHNQVKNSKGDRVFDEETWEQIARAVEKREKSGLEVVLRTTFGPTATQRNFEKGLKIRSININTAINWWSAGSPFGVLEIETIEDYKIIAVWYVGEKNQVLSIMPKDDLNISLLIDSLASSNLHPGVMRTFSHDRFPGG